MNGDGLGILVGHKMDTSLDLPDSFFWQGLWYGKIKKRLFLCFCFSLTSGLVLYDIGGHHRKSCTASEGLQRGRLLVGRQEYS